MTPLSPATRLLFRKELRQKVRNRQAMVSTTLLPVLLLVIVPGAQLFALLHGRASGPANLPAQAPPGLAGLGTRDFAALYLLPLFVCLAGVLAPAVTAVVSIVTEREQRTIELLVALPVTVVEIVSAKLLATLAAVALVTAPLTLLDAAAGVLYLGQPLLYAPLLVLLLGGSMVASVCLSAVIAMLARDYRTSQQLSGLLVFPILLVVNLVLPLVPGLARIPVLALVLALSGVLAAWLAVRRFPFERYLS